MEEIVAIVKSHAQALPHLIHRQTGWKPDRGNHSQRASHHVHEWPMGIHDAGLHRSW